MRYLLDTHTLIWWWDQTDRLSPNVIAVLQSRESDVFVSAATAWELGTKFRFGKLPTLGARIETYGQSLVEDGFKPLDVRPDHGLRGGLLGGDHRDPFDRLLAAQALVEDLTVLTRDPEIGRFGCKVFW
ncbi:type II toxin-antitoxin system VapC family toxin [Sphingomonas xinjiangensis]|uniref:PIN domain nuclease of toxin-antitoxin system n=1 Tax=Sphingomonas xinjiangensis TaxID=643568 RepID=A0A840YPQ7_9SPHN|nr:PIN domain nuclease of toxin-antitoxin system [Sphingomonas xinjiangensis]